MGPITLIYTSSGLGGFSPIKFLEFWRKRMLSANGVAIGDYLPRSLWIRSFEMVKSDFLCCRPLFPCGYPAV
jgi:hypothetical protein